MTIRRVIAFFFGIFLLVACSKDPEIILNPPETITVLVDVEPCALTDTCPGLLIPCSSIGGTVAINLYPLIEYVTFNPLNANEFVFCKRFQNNALCLVQYYLNSGITNTLVNNLDPLKAEPFWSTDGNIYYKASDSKIHRFSPMDHTETTLPFPTGFNSPKVIQETVFLTGSSSRWPVIYYKFDLQGKILDSIYGPSKYCSDISSDYKLAFGDTNSAGFQASIATYTGNSRKITRLTNFFDKNINMYLTQIKWHPNNEELFFMKNAMSSRFKPEELYKLNLNTNKLVLIKRSCAYSKFFKNFAVSSDGKKILINTMEYKQLGSDTCNITVTTKLILMDSNGCNEKEIRISP